MARYNSAHKAKSRAAIMNSAATLFRRHGYRGVGIDKLCAAAGLTRGAFYSHFASKADLFREVLIGPHDMIRRLVGRKPRSATALVKAGSKVARDYLNVRHRKAVLGGCSIASLAMDTFRADAQAQAAYADAVEHIVGEFRRGSQTMSRQQAQAALALCVGGLLIGAACGEHPVADQVARAASKQVVNLLLEEA